MKKQIVLLNAVLVFAVSSGYGQKTEPDSAYRKFYVGSSAFMVMNLNTNDPDAAEFVQLNFGYRITATNVIAIEAKTWKYAWPLGIPYGKSKTAADEKYPGFVRTYGVAFAYQHFWWKGAYTSIEALNALQRYMGEDNKHIQSGYQLFMTYRLGYHFQLFKNRFFIEPSLAITHWPINTNVPESFAKLESKWPNYFLFEPGLHFGVKF
jgi:hypothetical protein